MATPSKSSVAAASFLAAAKAAGFSVTIPQFPSGVVSVEKSFTPGDMDAFATCDMRAPGVLAKLGAKGGSQWGTDGGSVGGHSAIIHGRFKMNQSGVPLRLAAALAKLV